jgi:hypothetical protein
MPSKTIERLRAVDDHLDPVEGAVRQVERLDQPGPCDDRGVAVPATGGLLKRVGQPLHYSGAILGG